MTAKPEDELAQRLAELIQPTRTEVLRAKRAVIARSDDGLHHTGATLLDSVSDALGAMRDIDKLEVQFLESPTPDLIDASVPAVSFLRARIAGMFAVAQLEAAGVLQPAVPPAGATESTNIRWVTEDPIRVGIKHPSGGYGVPVSVARPVLEQAYMQRSSGESWYRDPDLFLEDLGGLKLDERAQRALREAIRAYGRGLYLATASLLGVVSEAAWYGAAERLGMPGKLAEEVRNERTAKVQALVAGILRDRKAGAPTLPDELLANAALLRELRNYGVHPVKERDDLERYFNEEECGLLLLRTHNYLMRLAVAVQAASSS